MAQDQDKLDQYAISNEGVLLLEIVKRLTIGQSGNGPATEDTLLLLLAELETKDDRELIRDRFIAVVADIGNGYSIGDELSRISYFDISSGSSTLIDTFWFNNTTDLILTTVDINDLEQLGESSLPNPGVSSNKIDFGTADNSLVFLFDSDTISVINKTDVDVTLDIDGVLGGVVVIPPASAQDIIFGAATVGELDYSGVSLATSGSVYITNLRTK